MTDRLPIPFICLDFNLVLCSSGLSGTSGPSSDSLKGLRRGISVKAPHGGRIANPWIPFKGNPFRLVKWLE